MQNSSFLSGLQYFLCTLLESHRASRALAQPAQKFLLRFSLALRWTPLDGIKERRHHPFTRSMYKKTRPLCGILKVYHRGPFHQPPIPVLKSLLSHSSLSTRQLFPNVSWPPAPLGPNLHCRRIMRPVSPTMSFTFWSLATTLDAILCPLSLLTYSHPRSALDSLPMILALPLFLLQILFPHK